jgi:hypothetical protein
VWIAGGNTYPDTRQGWQSAYNANGGSNPDAGASVTATNSSATGGTLSEFNIESDDSAGTPIDTVTLSANGDATQANASYSAAPDTGTLPQFIAPGESYSYTLDYTSASVGVAVSFATYLAATCQVPIWYHPGT